MRPHKRRPAQISGYMYITADRNFSKRRCTGGAKWHKHADQAILPRCQHLVEAPVNTATGILLFFHLGLHASKGGLSAFSVLQITYSQMCPCVLLKLRQAQSPCSKIACCTEPLQHHCMLPNAATAFQRRDVLLPFCMLTTLPCGEQRWRAHICVGKPIGQIQWLCAYATAQHYVLVWL